MSNDASTTPLPHVSFWSRLWSYRLEIALACLSGFILFSHLGSFSIMEHVPDEGWYAEVAREMVERGDYLTPYYLDEPFLEKPPLFFWLQACSIHCFGQNEFAVRFPSAVASLLLLVLLYVFGRRIGSARLGALSVLILCATLHFSIMGRIGMMDALFTFFVSLNLCLLYFSLTVPAQRTKMFLAASAAAALAFLVKGPPAVIFPLTIGCSFLLLTGQLSLLRQLPLLRGFALFSVIALPWFISLYLYHGQAFVQVYIYEHILNRISKGDPFVMPSGAPTLWDFLGISLFWTLPWTLFLPLAILEFLRRGRKLVKPENYPWLFLLLWMLIIPALFAWTLGRYPHYSLPAFPAMALLLAGYFESLADRVRSFSRLAMVTMGMVVALLWIGMGIRFAVLSIGTPWLVQFAVLLILGGVAMGAMFAFRRARWVPWCCGLFWCANVLVFIFLVLPKLQHERICKDLAQSIESHYQPGTRIIFYRAHPIRRHFSLHVLHPQAIAFYLPDPCLVTSDVDEVRRIMAGEEDVICVTNSRDYDDRLADLPAHLLAARNIYTPLPMLWNIARRKYIGEADQSPPLETVVKNRKHLQIAINAEDTAPHPQGKIIVPGDIQAIVLSNRNVADLHAIVPAKP